jgi:hypothetical protein
MNEVYIDIRTDDELQEIFASDFVSVEELRNKLIDFYYQINKEEDNYDSWMDQELMEEL